ncbi:hypothetical protein LJ737_21270 [Hymenobacter sp. 15J16-1T3B]|uniref:hypothetical protein n=1 Tax=Hymenobacter sp. 15J16-1T3B TaxID=2886941 RepID=UPI001D1280F3|nr:hypothetical protein [Hymenobacter sp. 15J16-1T3B]MCC3159786.1 hypothetical protein [Hymenobacter sp. 15J16-1T3B]
MLDNYLVATGFYQISWPDGPDAKPGITFVRPGARESLRVFLCAAAPEMEVYTGDLQNGRLVYRGPAEVVEQLRNLAERQN